MNNTTEETKVTTKKTQNTLVREHLEKHGYITPLVASTLGVTRLAARIYDIETSRSPINRELRRDDAGKRYTYYTLAA